MKIDQKIGKIKTFGKKFWKIFNQFYLKNPNFTKK